MWKGERDMEIEKEREKEREIHSERKREREREREKQIKRTKERVRERESERTFTAIAAAHFTDTGWRRPIGCLKLQIIFRKRATNYRALLRKMTYGDKASCGSSPPCRS